MIFSLYNSLNIFCRNMINVCICWHWCILYEVFKMWTMSTICLCQFRQLKISLTMYLVLCHFSLWISYVCISIYVILKIYLLCMFCLFSSAIYSFNLPVPWFFIFKVQFVTIILSNCTKKECIVKYRKVPWQAKK